MKIKNEEYLSDILAKNDHKLKKIFENLEKYKKYGTIKEINEKIIDRLKVNKYKKYWTIKEINKKIIDRLKVNKYNSSDIIKEFSQIDIEYGVEYHPEKNFIEDTEEQNIQKSLKRLFPDKEICWKPCRVILGKEDLSIFPKKINYSNFNQGHIGDCYFISCINALSQIPELLNFIVGPEDKENHVFKVKFYIDGEWKIINIKDSFPAFKIEENKYELVGVKPHDNELFMMILEKAWAHLNGGYDLIDGGNRLYIFELFLGSSCVSYKSDSKELFNAIKENEKYFGTLTLCGAKYYKINNSNENNINKKTFSKELLLSLKNLKVVGAHAYRIIKSFEISKKDESEKYNTFKFLIISNPHGNKSKLIGSGIELKKIEEIIEKELGKENKDKYEYILEKNNKYEETGIIYMPMDYFKSWSYNTTLSFPHYDCMEYIYNHKDEVPLLYIFKIKFNKKKLFTFQTCFQSYRAHRNIIDVINFKIKNKKQIIISKEDLLLNYNFCGINIIKKENDKDFTLIDNYYSYNYMDRYGNLSDFSNDYDKSSIKELNSLLNPGEYFIMIYAETSLNKYIIRFLVEKEEKQEKEEKIEINLVNKIYAEQIRKKISNQNVFEFLFRSIKEENYKEFLKEELNTNIFQKKRPFLPSVRKYYLHFKTLAEKLKLKPDEAIYSISEDGESKFYDIIEVNTLNRIYRDIQDKNGNINIDKIDITTILFRDNLGNLIPVNDFQKLLKEIRLNRYPINCLFSEFDENTRTLRSGSVNFSLYYNKAKNEDILVVTDKSGNYKIRENSPLFIIILDVSGSMTDYKNYLVRQIIPKLLEKLDYIWEDKEFYNKLVEAKITNFELL